MEMQKKDNSLLGKLREDANNWKVDPVRPLTMLTGTPEEKKSALQMPKIEKKEEPEAAPAEPTPEDSVKQLEAYQPPKEAPSKETQLINEQLNLARQNDLPRTNAGIGPYEPQLRATIKAPRFPNKEQAQELFNKAALARRGLTAEQQEYYDTQLENVRMQTEELYSRLETMRQSEVEQSERVDMAITIAQAVEHIGHGFARLFAANYGLKKGVDMSGMVFDKFDFDSVQKRYDKRFNRIIESLDKKQEKLISSQETQVKTILEAKSKEEQALVEDARSWEKQGTALTAADSRAATETAIAQGRLDDAALERASRERMKAAELATRAALQAAAAAQKQSKTIEDKKQANLQAQLAVYDYIKSQLPREGKLKPDELQNILRSARVDARKAGVELDPLVDVAEENNSWIPFASEGAEAVHQSIDARVDELLKSMEGTGTTETSPMNPEAGATYLSDDEIDSLLE